MARCRWTRACSIFGSSVHNIGDVRAGRRAVATPARAPAGRPRVARRVPRDLRARHVHRPVPVPGDRLDRADVRRAPLVLQLSRVRLGAAVAGLGDVSPLRRARRTRARDRARRVPSPGMHPVRDRLRVHAADRRHQLSQSPLPRRVARCAARVPAGERTVVDRCPPATGAPPRDHPGVDAVAGPVPDRRGLRVRRAREGQARLARARPATQPLAVGARRDADRRAAVRRAVVRLRDGWGASCSTPRSWCGCRGRGRDGSHSRW